MTDLINFISNLKEKKQTRDKSDDFLTNVRIVAKKFANAFRGRGKFSQEVCRLFSESNFISYRYIGPIKPRKGPP